MKLINIVLSLIVGIVIFLLFSSFLYKYMLTSLNNESWIYLCWTYVNGVAAGIVAIDIAKSFFNWFKSHIK